LTGVWLRLPPARAVISSALLGSLGQQVESQLLSTLGLEISRSFYSIQLKHPHQRAVSVLAKSLHCSELRVYEEPMMQLKLGRPFGRKKKKKDYLAN
jgi:hypothetical protein